MDLDQLKNLLKRYNLRPNFTYGQNFLIDDLVLQDIVDAAQVTSEDAVLEIGPGIGNLTSLLCERAGFVLSIEKDPKFLPILKSIKKDFPKNFRFEIADVLEYNFQSFLRSAPIHRPSKAPINLSRTPIRDGHAIDEISYKVVANIPYYITGKILQMLLSGKFKPSSITILTQKEVAQNIIAAPGDLSILAISVQLFGEPKIIQTVSAKSFYPAPKVDSAVLQIVPYRKPKNELDDENFFFRIVKACFAGKRKQIHNTLTNNLGLDKNRVSQILTELNLKPSARPQELSINQWIELAKKISTSLTN